MLLKPTLTLALTAILTTILPAQNPSPIDGRWTVKLMHRLQQENKPHVFFNEFWEAVGTNQLEVNYGFARYVEVGAHLGVYKSSVAYLPGSQPYIENEFQYVYGANLNLHLLPLFVRSSDFRFDLYALGRLSNDARKLFNSEPRYHQGIAGVGAGLGVYPTRHIGLNAEYVRHSYTSSSSRAAYSPWSTVNLGVSIKFR